MVDRKVEIKVDVKGEGQVDKLAKSLDTADREAKQLNTTMTKTAQGVSKGVGSIGRASGQAGIQFQQFIGQIQGGQSAMLALSQQSADLGFVLGAPLLGAVVGISASIAGILFSSLVDSKDAVVSLSDEVNGLVKDFNELSEESKQITRLSVEQTIEKQEKALVKLKEEVNDVNVGFGSLFSSQKEIGEERQALNIKIAEQEALLKKTKETLDDLTGSKKEATELERAESEAIQELIVQLVRQADLYGKTDREISIYQATLLGATDAELNAINVTFDRIESLEAQEQKIKDVAKAQAEANKLAEQQRRAEEKLTRDVQGVSFRAQDTEGQLATRLGNDLLILQQGLEAGILVEQQAFDLRLQLAENYYEQLAELRDKDLQNDDERREGLVKGAAGFVGQLQQINQKSDGLKRAAIISSTAVAVIESYRNGGGYPYGLIPAGIMAAIGAKQLSQVGKKSGISGGGGGGGGGASAGLTQPTLTQQTTFNTIESTALTELNNELRNRDPDEYLPISFVRRMVGSIEDAQSSGQV